MHEGFKKCLHFYKIFYCIINYQILNYKQPNGHTPHLNSTIIAFHCAISISTIPVQRNFFSFMNFIMCLVLNHLVSIMAFNKLQDYILVKQISLHNSVSARFTPNIFSCDCFVNHFTLDDGRFPITFAEERETIRQCNGDK